MPDQHPHENPDNADLAGPEAAIGAAVSALAQLSDELRDAWHPAHAAHLLDQLTAQDQGLITQLHQVITDAGHWALELPSDEGQLMYIELLHAAARLESVRVQIAQQTGALVRFSSLVPARTSQAATFRNPGPSGSVSSQVPASPTRGSTAQRR
ncbi:hypothetical protein ACWCXK_05975 [Streptomyces sp. NPDC001739]